VGCISLNCLDKTGNQVMTFFKLYIDAAPGFPDIIHKSDKPVVYIEEKSSASYHYCND
jgi:hypothetical protein